MIGKIINLSLPRIGLSLHSIEINLSLLLVPMIFVDQNRPQYGLIELSEIVAASFGVIFAIAGLSIISFSSLDRERIWMLEIDILSDFCCNSDFIFVFQLFG